MQSLSTYHRPIVPLPYSLPQKSICYMKSGMNKKERIVGLRSSTRDDVIIVGGGVAGSALAHTLGKDGRQVHLIEKNLSEPNTVVGEVLQPAGYLKLLELGLEACVREIDAQVLLGYAIYKDGNGIKISFPTENYDDNNHVAGRTFHHGRFVQKLRHKAASLPNVRLQQGTATAVIEESGEIKGVKYKTSDGQELTSYAPLTIICDGHFSKFRKFLSQPKINKPSHSVCLIVENCKVPHPNYAHVIVGIHSTVVIYAISSNEVRFSIDFLGPKLPPISNGQMAHYLKTVVVPQIPPEMCSGFLSSVDKGDIRTMPISCMPATPRLIPGAILLGDALNMRHFVTGGGMTVALNDVALLSDLLSHLNLEDTGTVVKHTAHFYSSRKRKAFSMNVMADSLHKVLCASPEELREELQQAFFNYLSLGPVVMSEQSRLISGLSTNPWSLVISLLAMAFYIVGSLLLPVPSLKKMIAAAHAATVTAAGVIPIILDEGLGQVFFTTNPPTPKRKTHK